MKKNLVLGLVVLLFFSLQFQLDAAMRGRRAKSDASGLLLENSGALKDQDLNAALFKAIEEGKMGIVQSLLRRGVNVNDLNTVGFTPLHVAVVRSKLKIATILLDAGANPNAVDSTKTCPLRLAAGAGYLGMVALLLLRGANPELQDNRGRTAQMEAQIQARASSSVGHDPGKFNLIDRIFQIIGLMRQRLVKEKAEQLINFFLNKILTISQTSELNKESKFFLFNFLLAALESVLNQDSIDQIIIAILQLLPSDEMEE